MAEDIIDTYNPDDEQRSIEAEGRYYLGLLELAHLADEQIPGHSGMPMSHFLQVCGDHARPLLQGLDSLDPDDPRYERTKQILKSYVGKFVTKQDE